MRNVGLLLFLCVFQVGCGKSPSTSPAAETPKTPTTNASSNSISVAQLAGNYQFAGSGATLTATNNTEGVLSFEQVGSNLVLTTISGRNEALECEGYPECQTTVFNCAVNFSLVDGMAIISQNTCKTDSEASTVVWPTFLTSSPLVVTRDAITIGGVIFQKNP